MAADVLQYAIGNAASTTPSASMSDSATTLDLTSDTNFNAKSGEGMVLVDEGLATEEFAYATGKTGSTLTIPLANRGLEGGSAQAHTTAGTVKGIITAGMWNNLVDSLVNLVSKTTGALDTTKVVNLSATQTLTNKTMDGDNNTFTDLPAANLKIASQAQGDILYYSGSAWARLGAGTNGQYLQTQGAGANPQWATVASSTSPSFSVTRSTTQSIADDSWVKIEFDTEGFDTNEDYDNATNYRFTPTVAGKYLFTMSVRTAAAVGDGKYLAVAIYKNGSEHKISYQFDGHASAISSSSVTDVIDANGSSDYFEFYVRQNSGGSINIGSNAQTTFASGSKIG